MRNQDAQAYGCLWLLGSGILSVVVPVLLSEAGVESPAVWYALAPGWRLFPFGHADVHWLLLAVATDASVYVAIAYFLLRAFFRVSGRERASAGESS